MKKMFPRVLLGLVAVGFLMIGISCKKCRECIAYEDFVTNSIYYYESQCFEGSDAKSNIDDWEAEFRAEYAGYYIICNPKN